MTCDNPKIAIGRKLKDLREKNNLTQAQLGEKVGKATTTVASWESGKSQPDIDTLFKILAVYNVENVLETFGYMRKTSQLSINERILINMMRELKLNSQKLVYQLASGLYNIDNNGKNSLFGGRTFRVDSLLAEENKENCDNKNI